MDATRLRRLRTALRMTHARAGHCVYFAEAARSRHWRVRATCWERREERLFALVEAASRLAPWDTRVLVAS